MLLPWVVIAIIWLFVMAVIVGTYLEHKGVALEREIMEETFARGWIRFPMYAVPCRVRRSDVRFRDGALHLLVRSDELDQLELGPGEQVEIALFGSDEYPLNPDARPTVRYTFDSPIRAQVVNGTFSVEMTVKLSFGDATRPPKKVGVMGDVLAARVSDPPYEVTLYVLDDDQPPSSSYVENGTITIDCPNPTVVWLRRRSDARALTPEDQR